MRADFRFVAAAFFTLLIGRISAEAEAPKRAPWVEARLPYESEFGDITFDIPAGYRLCTPPAGFPGSDGALIPLDRTMTCDRFDQSVDQDLWPDRVHFIEWYDASDDHHDVSELVQDVCVSHARVPATLKPMGKVFGGIDAITCVFPASQGIDEVTYAHHPLRAYGGHGSEPRLKLVVRTVDEAAARTVFNSVLTRLKVTEPHGGDGDPCEVCNNRSGP